MGAVVLWPGGLRERLNRRAHLIRMRTTAKNRVLGALSHGGLRIPVQTLGTGEAMGSSSSAACPPDRRRSIAEALAVIDILA